MKKNGGPGNLRTAPSVISAPAEKLAAQSVPPLPQLMPGGEEVMFTIPSPDSITLIVKPLALVNVAAHIASAVRLIVVVVAVPEQAPLHPENTEPMFGDAVSCTEPLNNPIWLEHAGPQLTPVGADITVPVPSPPLLIVKLFKIRRANRDRCTQ